MVSPFFQSHFTIFLTLHGTTIFGCVSPDVRLCAVLVIWLKYEKRNVFLIHI